MADASVVVYIDTNIWVYLFQKHSRYGDKVAQIITDLQASHELVCSTLVITECLAAKLTNISLTTFQKLPGLTLLPLDAPTAAEAGQLQRDTPLKIGDAIHLATALHQKPPEGSLLLTNDRAFAKVVAGFITVKTLADYV